MPWMSLDLLVLASLLRVLELTFEVKAHLGQQIRF